MQLSEIIQDIHGLDGELAKLETRYGLLSEDFTISTKPASWNKRVISFSGLAITKPNSNAKCDTVK